MRVHGGFILLLPLYVGQCCCGQESGEEPYDGVDQTGDSYYYEYEDIGIQLTSTGCPVCVNGGESIGASLENSCQCICTEAWQGPLCQHNRYEIASGVQLHMKGNFAVLADSWRLLTLLLANAINTLCSIHTEVCCPGALRSFRYTNHQLSFVTPSDVRMAQGFPVVDSQEEDTAIFLSYVQYTPFNQLCQAARLNKSDSDLELLLNDTEVTGQAYAILPQEILWKSIDPIKKDIRKTVWNMFNIQLTTLQRGVVVHGPGPPTLPRWALFLVCSLTASVVLMGVAVHYLILKACGDIFMSDPSSNIV